MEEELYLHIPSYDELWYRKQLLCDPDTMSYNKGYDMDIDGYDRQTGCIDFSEDEWADFYDYFIGNEPQRYYAYIARRSDGKWIGEVNLHGEGDGRYDMGIVIEHKHRGNGHAVSALKLLIAHAFEKMGATSVHNDFENTRSAAIKTHLSAGFEIINDKNDIMEFAITRERYFKLKKSEGQS